MEECRTMLLVIMVILSQCMCEHSQRAASFLHQKRSVSHNTYCLHSLNWVKSLSEEAFIVKYALTLYTFGSDKMRMWGFLWSASVINVHVLPHLNSGVVAALLHVQQRAALAASSELDFQAAGPDGVMGCALQRLSQQNVTFGALFQGIVQASGTVQRQSGVCCHVCAGETDNVLMMSEEFQRRP